MSFESSFINRFGNSATLHYNGPADHSALLLLVIAPGEGALLGIGETLLLGFTGVLEDIYNKDQVLVKMVKKNKPNEIMNSDPESRTVEARTRK